MFCWPEKVPVQCGECGASPGSLSLKSFQSTWPEEHFVLCIVKYTHITSCQTVVLFNTQNVIKRHSFLAFLKKGDAVCWCLVSLLQIF